MTFRKTAAPVLALLLCLALLPFGAAASEEPAGGLLPETGPEEDIPAEAPAEDADGASPEKDILPEAAEEEVSAPADEEAPGPAPSAEPAVPAEEEPDAVLDGDSTYVINGVSVSRTSSSITDNCFTYALEIYRKIWGTDFSSDPSSSDNMLRNITSAEGRRLTAENVKKYISAAALGSVIRLTGSAYLNTSSGSVGHSQLLVQKDADGFTVLESNVTGGSREKYYTWAGYVSWWKQTADRDYFHYIKWPGASPYSGQVTDPGPSPLPADECSCSEAYEGTYICTASSGLTIRSGHGTSFSRIGGIPSGGLVHVVMGDGSWAHVEYEGLTGYASMKYLARIEPLEEPEDLDGDGWIDQRDAAIYLRRGQTWLAALSVQYALGSVPG